MVNDWARHAEKYYDPTAYAALLAVYAEERRMKLLELKRGDVFYIQKSYYPAVGSEQQAGRPGIIVSSDENNRNSNAVEVVYCTTKEKEYQPAHAIIMSTRTRSTVLCEQITTVSIDRLGTYIGRCTPEEMEKIDQCLLISLGLAGEDFDGEKIKEEAKAAVQAGEKEESEKVVYLRAQLDVLKKMYKIVTERLAKELTRNGKEW